MRSGTPARSLAAAVERSAIAPARSSAKTLAMPRSASVSVSSRGTSAGAAGRNASRARPSGPRPCGKKGDRQHAQGRVAHGGRGGADRRRPLTPFDRLRDPARDQAQHRQLGSGRGAYGRVPGPVVGLPRLQQAVLGRGGPAREEIQCAQQPAPPRARPGGRHPGGKDLRLGHLAVDDQDLQRVQQTAIGCPGSLLAAAACASQAAACAVRPRSKGLPAGRLQLGRPAGRPGRPRPPPGAPAPGPGPTRPAARWCSRRRRAGLRSA